MVEDDQRHALAPYLQSRLPELGLDYDTYGPYILPLLTDETPEEEEWDTVVELLAASSSTLANDDPVWNSFRDEIKDLWKKHQEDRELQMQELHLQRELEIQQQISNDRKAVLEEALEKETKQQEQQQQHTTDETKQRLLEQYGYDNDDIDQQQDNDDTMISNRQAAQQLAQAKMQGMREHKHPTKREEQQKTAQAKMNKQQLKEARRKKAGKMERKR